MSRARICKHLRSPRFTNSGSAVTATHSLHGRINAPNPTSPFLTLPFRFCLINKGILQIEFPMIVNFCFFQYLEPYNLVLLCTVYYIQHFFICRTSEFGRKMLESNREDCCKVCIAVRRSITTRLDLIHMEQSWIKKRRKNAGLAIYAELYLHSDRIKNKREGVYCRRVS
jgi:hypothetical protein